ncbi:hypothetical protein BGZ75_000240 [Mortierella antarctica]|nr:hypothetical protein BGZ75_000240 [Mortierella antarctica]
MSAGTHRSSQASRKNEPLAKHDFQPSQETILAEQLTEPEIEAVLNGPPDSMNNFYQSKTDVHKELAKRFLDEFDLTLTDSQIKNKIATMRRKYSKAAACKKETGGGRTRSLADLKKKTHEIYPFFDIVDDNWSKPWSLNPRPPLDSGAGVSDAERAFDSDEDGSIQKLDHSTRLPR